MYDKFILIIKINKWNIMFKFKHAKYLFIYFYLFTYLIYILKYAYVNK